MVPNPAPASLPPPLPLQNSWKLPGGLADPGEDFADTAAREVLEETGVRSELDGIVSLRHSHGRRYNQGDIYVVVRLRATSDEIALDSHELRAARWMSYAEIASRVESKQEKGSSLDDKVSTANWEMIQCALRGTLIEAVEVPSSKGVPTFLYRAPAAPSQIDIITRGSRS